LLLFVVVVNLCPETEWVGGGWSIVFELFLLCVLKFLYAFTVLAAPVGDTTLKTGEVGVLYDVFVRPCGALLRFCSPCTIQIF
jgi:hypothetical protein